MRAASSALGNRMAARLTMAERRADIVDAAIVEFAKRGLEGTSTYDIARRAGISQPYLFRLFGTKKGLFKAATEQCFRSSSMQQRERTERTRFWRSETHTSTRC